MTVVTQKWKEEENDLILRSRQGERSAFAELICRHQRGVINVVYRMCGDAQLAEDAAQEAFIRAWRGLSGYRPTGDFRSWLYRIALNAGLDMLRRQKRETEADMENMADCNTPEALLVRKESADRVRAAVLTLSEASRAVLILREYEGLSYQEIAAALDIPTGTVMSRLNYARTCLRTLLGAARGVEVDHA